MRVAVITSLYKPYSRGGAERVVELVVLGLRQAGHQVLVITTGPKLRKKGLYRFWPANIFWFGNINKYPALLRLIWQVLDVFNFHSYFVVKRILKQEKPDLVLTHNLKGIGYLVPRAIKSTVVRHIHTVHDVQLVVPAGLIKAQSTPSKLKVFYPYLFVCRWLFGSPKVVVSPSKWLADFYKERGFFKKSEIKILPNPILVTCNMEHGKQRKRNGVSFLYVGQLEKHKGILFLIDVFKKLRVTLQIVGAGTQLEKIKKLVQSSSNIEILGPVYGEELDKILHQTDFTIVPSLCLENSPMVISQSFSHGIPVVAANIGGIPELVKNNENGFIFESADTDSLVEALNKCDMNKNHYEEMSKNALETVKNYTLKNYIDSIC